MNTYCDVAGRGVCGFCHDQALRDCAWKPGDGYKLHCVVEKSCWTCGVPARGLRELTLGVGRDFFDKCVNHRGTSLAQGKSKFNLALALVRAQESCNLSVAQKVIFPWVLSKEWCMRGPHPIFKRSWIRVIIAKVLCFILRRRVPGWCNPTGICYVERVDDEPPEESTTTGGGTPTHVEQDSDVDGIYEIHGWRALSMKTYSLYNSRDRPAINIAPQWSRVEHWADDGATAEQAVMKRFVLPKLPCTLSRNKKTALRRVAMAVVARVFTKDAMNRWIEEHADIVDCKSKTWSEERWLRAYYQVMSASNPRYDHAMSVKDEVLEDLGKDKPRLIVADKDQGQVMAVAVIKMIEDLWFAATRGHNVKYMSKPDAMQMVNDQMRRMGPGYVLEADGSAWDACCNLDIRRCTENPVIWHVTQHLLGRSPVHDDAMMAHWVASDKRKQSMRHADRTRVVIDAVRRSGHRGTSILNGMLNYMLWTFVLSDDPEHDIMGSDQYYLATEGDDALIFMKNDRPMEDMMAFWQSCGFNMKIKKVDEGVVAFTGYHHELRAGRVTGRFCPDLWRNVVSCSYSTSAELREAVRKGDHYRAHTIAAAALASRALSHKSVPPMRAYYTTLSRNHLSLGGDSVPEWCERVDGASVEQILTALSVDGQDTWTQEDQNFWTESMRGEKVDWVGMYAGTVDRIPTL